MILVLGASGTVGRHLVRDLAHHGARVRAAHHRRPVKHAGVEPVRLDLGDVPLLRTALDGVRDLFLLTPDGPNQREAQLRVIDEAQSRGVARIVFLSVLGAETESFAYARVHRAAERAIVGSGLHYTILRPNAFMQNFVGFYGAELRATGRLRLPCGEAAVSHIDATDVARVASTILRSDAHYGRIYELTGPRAITFREAAVILGRARGVPTRYEPVDEANYRRALRAAGAPSDAVERLIEQHRFARAGHAAAVTDHVLRITGAPPCTFEAFARSAWREG